MAKQTIGIVLNNTPGYSETFFHNKINSLMKEGFHVVLFAKKGNKVPTNWDVVPPYSLPDNKAMRTLVLVPVLLQLALKAPGKVKKFVQLEKKAGNSWKRVMENLYINAHILGRKFDWLHFGFATTALRRENVAKVTGAKMAVSFRGYDIAVYPLKNKGCYDLLWKRVDKVHTISDDLVVLAHHFGLSKDKNVVKITPAIDYNKFHIADRKPVPGLNILTVARLNWKKGLSYALHAMKILKNKGIEFQYTIIGDGSEKESLVFEIYQLGLTGNVTLTGIIPSDKISEYYKQNSIYLQPSVQEGFCNSVLEAQAAGMLCIVSDAEGLGENVLNKQTGWVIPKRDATAIADAVLYAHNLTEAGKKQITDNAQARVLREFTLEKQTKEFIDFYTN